MLRITSPFAALLFLLFGAFYLASCHGPDNHAVVADRLTVARRSAMSEMSGAPDTVSSAFASDARSGEEYAEIVENDFIAANDEPLSTFAIDVDAASYSNTRRFITDGSLPPPDAVRVEELINYFEYDYPQPSGAEPFSVVTEVSECPWNPSHRLLHVGLQGRRMQSEQLPPSNLTFLIDVSGSMQPVDRLPLLKQSFHLLVNQLTPRDRVAIVVYAGAAGEVLSSTSAANKQKIHDAIDALEAGGSTAGAEGIVRAYEIAQANFIDGGNNRVILATDGDFNVGVSSDEALVKLIEEKREHGVFLSVLGFGMGNLKDAKMEKIADHGNGNYAYIDGEAEAKKVFMTEIGGTLFTIAKDVKVQVVFNPAKVKEYRLVGYENRLLANEDFDNDAKDAGELGAGHSVTALYEIVPGEAVTGVSRKGLDTLDLPAEFWRDQLVQIRLRYKEPNSSTSKLLAAPAVDRGSRLAAASDNFRFSAAVAEFGLLLRGSKHVASGSYDDVIGLAKNAIGRDLEGYRAQFVDLVKAARTLDSRAAR